MNDKDRFIFLLGGADLEMCAIRQLLDQNGYRYYDKHLRWENACLSAYRKEITDYTGDDTPLWVGIELQEDMNFPSNYISIDHHNRNAHKPSSLEQVAELLEIHLSRQEQLIAANDRAYIPGMKALQASHDEITEIRRRDRMCQGVTEEDEALAVKAINENMEQVNGLIVVKALSSCFSPICDRLFPYRSLLVYTEREWMYYGIGADCVLHLFAEDYCRGKLFCGGAPDGYVGTKKAVYTENQINEMIKKISYECT